MNHKNKQVTRSHQKQPDSFLKEPHRSFNTEKYYELLRRETILQWIKGDSVTERLNELKDSAEVLPHMQHRQRT